MSDIEESTDDEAQPLRQRIPWLRIGSVLGVVLLVLIVLPFVIYMVPQVVGAEHSYVVLSGSMEPAISPGDVVIVGSVAPADIQTGDVITFLRGGEDRPTTHRVIEVVQQDGGPAFRTMGDNNEDPDQQLVTPAQIEGEVMQIGGFLFVIPLIGHAILFAGTQTGFLLLVAVPVVLFILNEIWNVIAATRASDGEAADGTEASDLEAVEAQNVEEDSDGDGDSAITFTASELQLGIAITTAFLAYSAWVAYVTLEVWSMGVAGAVGATLLLLVGLYILGGHSGGDEEGKAADTTDSVGGEVDSGEAAEGSSGIASEDREGQPPTPAAEPIDRGTVWLTEFDSPIPEPEQATDGGEIDD